jgi:hypothetical protein
MQGVPLKLGNVALAGIPAITLSIPSLGIVSRLISASRLFVGGSPWRGIWEQIGASSSRVSRPVSRQQGTVGRANIANK